MVPPHKISDIGPGLLVLLATTLFRLWQPEEQMRVRKHFTSVSWLTKMITQKEPMEEMQRVRNGGWGTHFPFCHFKVLHPLKLFGAQSFGTYRMEVMLH